MRDKTRRAPRVKLSIVQALRTLPQHKLAIARIHSIIANFWSLAGLKSRLIPEASSFRGPEIALLSERILHLYVVTTVRRSDTQLCESGRERLIGSV